MGKNFYCPRCGSKDIIDYADTLDCPKCLLEFDKKDFEEIDDKAAILSIKEKLSILNVFEVDLDKDRDKFEENDK